MAKVDRILNLLQTNEIKIRKVYDARTDDAAKVQDRLVELAREAGATEAEIAAALRMEW